MKTKEKSTLVRSTTKEKIFYGCGDAGGNFVWQFAAGFLNYYYTESAGIAAATVATMMLVSRFLDGLSDIVMGVLIEKCRCRWEKARTFILLFSLPLCASLILLMSVPSSLGTTGKTIYMYATYIFMTVICYTAVNLSYHAMVPMISADENDRSMISIVRNIISCAAIGLVNIITTHLLDFFGGSTQQRAWTIVAVIYAVCGAVCLALCVLNVKEKPQLTQSNTAEKIPLIQSLKATATNRYFFISMLIFVLHYMTVGFQGIGIYYANSILGSEDYYGWVTIVSAVPSVCGILIVPPLFKKFGKRLSVIMGMAVSSAACLLTLIAPTNLYLYLAMQALKTFGTIPLVTAMFTYAADIVDYGDWKTGIRAEGFAFTANSFGMKIGTGLGAAAVGWMLQYGGYIAASPSQPQSAINAIVNTNITFPAICYALILVLLLFWNLDKKYPHMKEDLQERHNKIAEDNSNTLVESESGDMLSKEEA